MRLKCFEKSNQPNNNVLLFESYTSAFDVLLFSKAFTTLLMVFYNIVLLILYIYRTSSGINGKYAT